jgi:hypothetical protein
MIRCSISLSWREDHEEAVSIAGVHQKRKALFDLSCYLTSATGLKPDTAPSAFDCSSKTPDQSLNAAACSDDDDDWVTHNSGHDCTRHMVEFHFACLAWLDLLKRGRNVCNVLLPAEWCLCVQPINRHPWNVWAIDTIPSRFSRWHLCSENPDYG